MCNPVDLRETIIEEIIDALALRDLGVQSDAYVIERLPDGSIMADFGERDQSYVITVTSRPRGSGSGVLQ
jgi:hypothetical protein